MSLFNRDKKDWADFLATASKSELESRRAKLDQEMEALRQKKRDIRDEIVMREEDQRTDTAEDQIIG